MSAIVDFYFDPISPYSWLAMRDLEQLGQDKAFELRCIPILLAGLLNALGQKGPVEIPSKRAYVFADVMRIAQKRGLALSGPPTHPFNPLPALRACHCLESEAARTALAKALLVACWEHGEDLSDLAVIEQVATRCELDGVEIVRQIQEPAIKAKLRDATEKALKSGIFGIPTLRVGQELFWGSDRVADAMRALHKDYHPIDPALLEGLLSLPGSAQR